MVERRNRSRYRAGLYVVLCLAGAVVGPHPGTAAQPPSPTYERAFRYPYAVPPLIETLVEVQRRQQMKGLLPTDPGEREEVLAPPEDLEVDSARLLPGAKQSTVVVPASGALPVQALEFVISPRTLPESQ